MWFHLYPVNTTGEVKAFKVISYVPCKRYKSATLKQKEILEWKMSHKKVDKMCYFGKKIAHD